MFVCSRSIFYVCSSSLLMIVLLLFSLFIGESLNPFTQEFALKLFEVAAQCDQIILIQERHVVLEREPVVLEGRSSRRKPLGYEQRPPCIVWRLSGFPVICQPFNKKKFNFLVQLSWMMILLLLFLQKQSLAFAVYLFGIGTLHTGPGWKKKKHM